MLKEIFEKVKKVLNQTVTSDRAVSTMTPINNGAYTSIGGKIKVEIDTDASKDMTVFYSSSNEQVGTVDDDGFVTGISSGSTVITSKIGEQSCNTTINIETSEIHDKSSIPTQDRTIDEIAIINPRDTLEVGDEYALYAVGISNNLSLKYDIGYYNPIKFSSSDPSVAGVMFGTLMAHKEGTCTITATDLNENATASFTLTVIPAQTVYVSESETHTPTIDNTGETDVTAAIATAITYASTNNYKKVRFPKGKYLMNGDNRPDNAAIEIPSNLIVDFNDSEIYFDDSATVATTGYTMFTIADKENVWLMNANFYGENAKRETWIRKEGDRTLTIGGLSKNIHVENCTFNYSPGFNVGIYHSWKNVGSFVPNTKISGNVEAGGLGENGEDIEASGTWRMASFVTVKTVSGGWTVGEYQGYRAAHMRSRLYDICFYDNDKNFLFRKRNCYVYQRYEYPEGVTPKFCRIAFFQESEPTTYDGDFFSFTMIVDQLSPKDVYFKNCTFKQAVSTGLSPQGGEHVVVDGCTFINNGVQDPYSHIDWEDGRQSAQGCIVRNCKFIRDNWGSTTNCQIINGYCRNVTFHDNYVYNSSFRSGNESTMQRCYNNAFVGGGISIDGKCDSIFAGNRSTATPTIIQNSVGNTHTMSIDNQVVN